MCPSSMRWHFFQLSFIVCVACDGWRLRSYNTSSANLCRHESFEEASIWFLYQSGFSHSLLLGQCEDAFPQKERRKKTMRWEWIIAMKPFKSNSFLVFFFYLLLSSWILVVIFRIFRKFIGKWEDCKWNECVVERRQSDENNNEQRKQNKNEKNCCPANEMKMVKLI